MSPTEVRFRGPVRGGGDVEPTHTSLLSEGVETTLSDPLRAAAPRTHPYPAAVDVRQRYRSADSEKSTNRLLYSLRGSVP